jgi:hypothetical protein
VSTTVTNGTSSLHGPADEDRRGHLGQTVSSAFELRSTDRSLAVAVSSTAGVLWFAAFALTTDGPFFVEAAG